MRQAIIKRLTKFVFLRIVGKPTTLQEIRMTFYRVIVMNMFWIDGDLPTNLDEKFEFAINPSWATSPKPKNSQGLRRLSEEMLIYLCSNLKRPAWVDYPNTLKANMSLNDVVQKFSILFDLSDENPS